MTIDFRDYNDKLYAFSRIPENYNSSIEKCIDSSRGYAIKLTNDDGRFVWVGIVFHDRNAAFDFSACFEEYLKKKKKLSKPFEVDNNLISNLKNQSHKKFKINIQGTIENETNIKNGFYK